MNKRKGSLYIMEFKGISKKFSTVGEKQYESIGDFWDEMSERYGKVYQEGTLKYEIEMFDDAGNCKIMFYR